MSAPKPWSYEVHKLSEGFSGIVYDAHGQRVGTDHLSEDDARLISAAPDMYEALQGLTEMLGRPQGIDPDRVRPLYDTALAARIAAALTTLDALDALPPGLTNPEITI